MSKRFVFVLACLLLVQSEESAAVLIDSGDGKGNTAAPVPDPGWRNVGACNGLTVIYLGDGWVLSAAHVGEKSVAFDGGVYPPVVGSRVVLMHSGERESDVELFRIDPYPRKLLPLPIRETAVPIAEPVLMIGNGYGRGTSTHWKQPSIADGYTWSEAKGMRWGTNVVTGAEIDIAVSRMTTRSFYTDFTNAGSRHEANATAGDSGGPVFTRNGSRWELAGVMYASNGFVGQPPRTTLYGNLTFASDLSYYREQIVEITTPQCGNGYLTIDEECDDGNTSDGDCCSATCKFEPRASACDDGLTCSVVDTCDGTGRCVGGPATHCDDADPCTADSCDEETGCGYAPIDGPGCSQ